MKNPNAASVRSVGPVLACDAAQLWRRRPFGQRSTTKSARCCPGRIARAVSFRRARRAILDGVLFSRAGGARDDADDTERGCNIRVRRGAFDGRGTEDVAVAEPSLFMSITSPSLIT